jgi:hypothetical protein
VDFQKHTSDELVDLFTSKPFQGQSPEQARIVFLSSDANYSPEISNDPFFDRILEYQKDGVAFWEKHDCHHPFLLPSYPFSKSMAGVPFHRNFSKVGLTSKHAEYVSFVELLDIPTIGNKSQNRNLFFQLVSKPHLEYLENLMTSGGNKLFFVSNGVLKDIEKIKRTLPVFQWLDFKSGQSKQYSKEINGNKIQEIYHFSSSQIHGQMEEIATAIEKWLE